MMRILILIIMLLPCSLGMYASAIDSLLSVLDKTIVMRRQYEEEKERYISLIKDELKQGRLTDMERYLIQNRLFAEYNSYISDSALHYINENILIATRLNNRQWINSSILNKGEFYQFNLSSCIRQQNSLTAQFVSFSLSNLANIFYPPQFLQ